MSKIEWCINQKGGIELIEQKPHLSASYIKEADDTLESLLKINGRWKVIMAYYACYSAVYSLLMKCGIKSEIHDCTIALMKILGFEKNEIEYIRKLKSDRIDAQYYLKNIEFADEKNVKEFVLKCKEISEELNDDKINEIRKMIK